MSLFFVGIDLLVFAAILYDGYVRKRLPTRQSLLFNLCALSQLYVILSNNVSMFFNDRYQQYPEVVLDMFNALFYLGFVFRGYIFFLYTMELLPIKRVNVKKFQWSAAAIMLIEAVFIIRDMIGEMFFYVDYTGYHTGRNLPYLYVGLMIYIFAELVLLMFYIRRASFSAMQKGFFLLYIMAQFVGVIARLFVDRAAGLGMAVISALAFIYIAFENPNIHMSAKEKMYSAELFYRVLNEWSEHGKYYIFAFSISRYIENMEIYGQLKMEAVVDEIGNFLHTAYPEYYAFYSEGRFALLSRKKIKYDILSDNISRRFLDGWKVGSSLIYLTPVFTAFDTSVGKYKGEDVIQLLQFVLTKREYSIEGAPDILVTRDEIEEMNHEIYIRKEMNHAAEDSLVRMFLQPIIDAGTGKVCGAEALMRLKDEDGNYISPGEFIPMAEKNGKILELGRAIYTEVCRFYKSYGDNPNLKWVNVNLSPVQCLVPTLPDELIAIADEQGVDTANIHLEITEEAFIEVPKLLSAMEQIQKNGYTFSLDDYGSGYSNMSRMRELPFSNVKLDKSIVWNHFEESDELLPLTIKSLKSLKYTITAEGVETREMAEHLAEMGVDYLQGYYFGKPLPEREFVQTYL